MLPLWGIHWHGICPHCHEPTCIYAEWEPWGYRCGSCDTFIKFEEMRFIFHPCPKVVSSPCIANRKSKEVHMRECVWASRIANHNRLECFPIGVLYLIKEREYNGCYYCLPECDTDKHVVTQEGMDRIFIYFATNPIGIDLAEFQLPLKNGLTWYEQPNGMYFDINKPTIIWVHGWGDVKTPNYPNFLYADRFLAKGYNVATYNWDQELLDLSFEEVCKKYGHPFPIEIAGIKVETLRDANNEFGTVVTSNDYCRELVLTQVWKTGGSGEAFRNTLKGFFGQEKLHSYAKEITLLGHSTAAQLICLGLRSFVEENNPLEGLKFRVVFADPWFPKPDSSFLYPQAWNKNPHYDTGLAVRILSNLSDKGNPVIFIVSTLVSGIEAVETLSGIKSKATCVEIWPDGFGEFLKGARNYTMMREKAYPWGANIFVHPPGVRHWYAIDWYCELVDNSPPPSYSWVYRKLCDWWLWPGWYVASNGRNVPSPNLSREDLYRCRGHLFEEKTMTYNPSCGALLATNWSGESTYTPNDDAFEEIWNW